MGLAETRLGKVARNETPAAVHIPYICHLDPYTVLTENHDLIQVIKLQGISYETVDDDLLNVYHEQRNNLYRNIARGNLALWTTLIRQREIRYPAGDYQGFAADLNGQYRARIEKTDLYRNDLYLAMVYRDTGALRMITAARKMRRQAPGRLQKHLKALRDLSDEVIKAFSPYEPRRLGAYRHGRMVCSEPLEYLGRLLNGRFERMPLARTDAKALLVQGRLSFGSETGEIRMTRGCRYFGALGVKEYCAETAPDMLDGLLTLPMEYILTQSFIFAHKQKAIENIQLQRRRLITAGDLSASQIDELDEALDDLASNRIVAGEHHLSLIPYADSIGQLEDQLAEARGGLGEAGLVVAREDAGMEAAFWAQLPGNFAYRARPALITSRNFAGFSPWHNFPTGHIQGNHWGPALALFKTISSTPYYFSFHRYETGMPPGNGAVIGPTGTGKTVAMGFMLALAAKFRGRRVFFDKDQGAAVMIRALDGLYSVIGKGRASGFNPLQLPPCEANLVFLARLIKRIAEMAGAPLTAADEREIDQALRGVMQLDMSERRLFNLLPFLNITQAGGVAERLARWCGDGDRAWVFDNETDQINLNNDCLGFDLTDVLDDAALRTPIAMYILHRIRQLIDGTPMIINFDEGWKYARDEVLGPELEDLYRTIRKQNGVIIFGTNDVGDVTGSETGRVILQQSQWQIYFPNPKARRDDYIKGMDVTEKEYEIIRALPEKSRCFLIKRATNSVVAQLDLGGLEEAIAVLSGSTETVRLMEAAINEAGEEAAAWLPAFHRRRAVGNNLAPRAGGDNWSTAQ